MLASGLPPMPDPSPFAVEIGVCVGLVALVGLSMLRSVIAGALGTAVVWAGASFVVWSMAETFPGDELNTLFWTVLLGVAGLIAGGLGGLAGKLLAEPPEP
jgi:hypothetical protein